MLHNIDIVTKCDFEWFYEEQEYHEQIIDHFKFAFGQWLDNCNVRSYGVVAINVIYFPDRRKFRIESINNHSDKILQELHQDKKFYNLYFF